MVLQHSGDALGMCGRRKQFGERRGDGFQGAAFMHKADMSFDGEFGGAGSTPLVK